METNGKWILLVDPFRNLLNAYRMILEEEGYLVETASSLKEAFSFISERAYSAVLSEVLVPLGETCRMIQEVREHHPSTLLLMVTNALIDDVTYERLLEAGADDILSKPCSPGRILTRIRKGLREETGGGRDAQEGDSMLAPLTGQTGQPVFTPSYFRKCLRREIKRARRHRHPVSLLWVEVPSGGGEAAGADAFRPRLVSELRAHIREEDFMGRENGNLGILLPDTDQEGARAVVSRLSGLVQTLPDIRTGDHSGKLAPELSFGVFTYPGFFSVPPPLREVVDEVEREMPSS
jgi:PleD family two-component response regulator